MGGMTEAQASLLSILTDGPATTLELEVETGLPATAIRGVMGRLAKARAVARRPFQSVDPDTGAERPIALWIRAEHAEAWT